jgi:hypothetical protein
MLGCCFKHFVHLKSCLSSSSRISQILEENVTVEMDCIDETVNGPVVRNVIFHVSALENILTNAAPQERKRARLADSWYEKKEKKKVTYGGAK